MADGGFIYAATRGNFGRLVLENSRRGLVLVDFWAPWVGPSLRQREMLVNLAEEYRGRFLLVTVNTDDEKQLAHDYGVRSLPLCKLFRHGRVVETLRGVQPRGDYREAVDRHLGPVADRVQQAALLAWEEGDAERAIRILAEGAMAEPANLELPMLLSKLLTQADRPEDAHAVLSALPSEALAEEPRVARLLAHLDFLVTAKRTPPREQLEQTLAERPDDLQVRYQLASLALVADDFEMAMAQLLEILRRDRNFAHGAATRGLQAVFETLGSDDPRVKPYRAEFFRLAY
jgi:putative thioredoxin